MPEAIPQRMDQLLLFTDQVEGELLAHSNRFREASEDKRRYALAFVRIIRDGNGRVPSVKEVGEEAGYGKSKAYDMARDPEVAGMIREAAQAHSDMGDVAGSIAYDILCFDAVAKVRQGTITAANVTSTQLKLLQDAKARLGLAPQVGAMAGVMLPDGTTVMAGAVGAEDDLSAILGNLQAQQRAVRELAGSDGRTPGAGSEAGAAESVRVVDIDEIEAGSGEAEGDSESEKAPPIGGDVAKSAPGAECVEKGAGVTSSSGPGRLVAAEVAP